MATRGMAWHGTARHGTARHPVAGDRCTIVRRDGGAVGEPHDQPVRVDGIRVRRSPCSTRRPPARSPHCAPARSCKRVSERWDGCRRRKCAPLRRSSARRSVRRVQIGAPGDGETSLLVTPSGLFAVARSIKRAACYMHRTACNMHHTAYTCRPLGADSTPRSRMHATVHIALESAHSLGADGRNPLWNARVCVLVYALVPVVCFIQARTVKRTVRAAMRSALAVWSRPRMPPRDTAAVGLPGEGALDGLRRRNRAGGTLRFTVRDCVATCCTVLRPVMRVP